LYIWGSAIKCLFPIHSVHYIKIYPGERRWRQNEKRWAEANRRLSRIEEALGVTAEGLCSRYVWEDLREEIYTKGEAVVKRARSAKVDNVDLLVETNRHVDAVEVKIRPRVKDVGALLAKADVVRHVFGKGAVPVLAGAWVGDDVGE